MSSFKRKVGPGGCEETESSEAENQVSHAPVKNPKPFIVPQSKNTTLFTSLSARLKPKPSVSKQAPTTHGVSKRQEAPIAPIGAKQGRKATLASANNSSSDSSRSPAIVNRKLDKKQVEESSDDERSRPLNASMRSRVHFERGLDEVRTNLDTFQANVNGRLTRIEESQAQVTKRQDVILAKLAEILEYIRNPNFSLDSKSASDAPAPKEEKQALVKMNPEADPELYEVCQRVDRAKAIGAELATYESPIKGFIRKGVCMALDIQDLTRPPMFYMKNGVPDFFPEEFRDKDGFCPAHLHWNLPFADNYPCIPTCLLMIKAVFPKGDSAYARPTGLLTDEQIILLICHGPFKTLKLRFNTLKQNSPDDPIVQEGGKRSVSRLEAKWFQRRGFCPEIKGMLDTRWEALWSKGVMSPEVRDGEGGFVVQRCTWRAGWFNNLVTSVDNAYRSLELAKPGTRTRARRTIEYVEGPPPTNLRSAEGKSLKIPLCMISKVWQKENQAWMEAMAHRIDTSLAKKPDVSAFVTAHPTPTGSKVEKGIDGCDEEAGDEGGKEGNKGGEDGEEGGKEGKQEAGGYDGDGYDGGYDSEDGYGGRYDGGYNGGYDSGKERVGKGEYKKDRSAVAKPGETDVRQVVSVGGGGDSDSDSHLYEADFARDERPGPQDMLPRQTPSIQPQKHIPIPIDPLLLPNPSGMHSYVENPIAHHPRVQANPTPTDTRGELRSSPDPTPQSPAQYIWPPAISMPPPPPLPEQNATTQADEPKKKTRKRVSIDTSVPSDGPPKKRRGRPPGALGKKTIAKREAVAAAAVAAAEGKAV